MNMWHLTGVVGLSLMGCAAGVADAEPAQTPNDAGEMDTAAGDRGDVAIRDVEAFTDGGWEEPRDAEDGGGEVDGGADPVEAWAPGDRPIGEGPFWPGTGRREFVASHFDDHVFWEAGVQGGYHIWIAAEVDRHVLDAIDEEARREIRHTYTFIHEDGELLATASRTGGFRLNEDEGTWQARGLYAVLQAPRRPSTMNDEAIRYELEVQWGDEMFRRQVWLLSQCCD
ncbi:hypothetical protein FRC91_03990 [Bradymonadales bacterium TMQ1]|nr:hypothetical protein FRC91_03990 [Bradymonadales bacterium TMQ1]